MAEQAGNLERRKFDTFLTPELLRLQLASQLATREDLAELVRGIRR